MERMKEGMKECAETVTDGEMRRNDRRLHEDEGLRTVSPYGEGRTGCAVVVKLFPSQLPKLNGLFQEPALLRDNRTCTIVLERDALARYCSMQYAVRKHDWTGHARQNARNALNASLRWHPPCTTPPLAHHSWQQFLQQHQP